MDLLISGYMRQFQQSRNPETIVDLIRELQGRLARRDGSHSETSRIRYTVANLMALVGDRLGKSSSSLAVKEYSTLVDDSKGDVDRYVLRAYADLIHLLVRSRRVQEAQSRFRELLSIAEDLRGTAADGAGSSGRRGGGARHCCWSFGPCD